jgi:hypothetical protein
MNHPNNRKGTSALEANKRKFKQWNYLKYFVFMIVNVEQKF